MEDLRHAALANTPQAPQAPQAPAPAPQAPALGIDPNLMYSDPAAYTAAVVAHAKQEARNEIAVASGAVVTPLASMARNQATSYRPEVWDRFGPEIDAVMARIPAQSRADLNLWREAVDIIAGRHVDELARSRAEQLIRSGDTGMLSTDGAAPMGAGGPSSASPIRKLFASNDPSIKPFRDEGLNAEDVINHGKKMGHSEEKWAEMLTRNSNRRIRA